MRASNLSTVTTELIESYGNTAKNVIHAYRMGNQRVARFVDQRWETAIQQTAPRLTAQTRENALNAQKTISGIYLKGVVATSDGAYLVVNKVVELAGKGVQQVATNANRFEKRTGVTTLNRLAKVAVPAVAAVGGLADKLERSSSQLANTVAGKKATVKVAAVKRVTPRKKALAIASRKASATKATSANDAVKAVSARVGATVRDASGVATKHSAKKATPRAKPATSGSSPAA